MICLLRRQYLRVTTKNKGSWLKSEPKITLPIDFLKFAYFQSAATNEIQDLKALTFNKSKLNNHQLKMYAESWIGVKKNIIINPANAIQPSSSVCRRSETQDVRAQIRRIAEKFIFRFSAENVARSGIDQTRDLNRRGRPSRFVVLRKSGIKSITKWFLCKWVNRTIRYFFFRTSVLCWCFVSSTSFVLFAFLLLFPLRPVLVLVRAFPCRMSFFSSEIFLFFVWEFSVFGRVVFAKQKKCIY